ncbi:hypothetical protein HDU97_008053 [Phlyctochytrium planicorne]|nr:hypothetical protein HDU97_008053 [Phlyctochytrium planicorne]
MLALSVTVDVACLASIFLLITPRSQRLIVTFRNRFNTFIRSIPALYNTFVLLGWLHPRLPVPIGQQDDDSGVGETKPLLPSTTASSLDLDRFSLFLLNLPAAEVAAAIPKFQVLWWTLIACSFGHVAFEVATLFSFSGLQFGTMTFPHGAPASFVLMFVVPSLLLWSTVMTIQLLSYETHPTALIIATTSSFLRSLSLASTHTISNFSSWAAFHLYLSVLAFTLCFLVFEAIRGRRQDEEDEALRKANFTVPCRELEASLFSRFYYSWVSPLIRLGKKKVLSLEDLPDLDPADKAESAIAVFSLFKKTTRIQNLGFQLLWLELPVFTYQICCSLVANSFAVLGPYLLYKITDYIEAARPDASALEPLFYAALLGFISMTRANLDAQVWHSGRHAACRIRSVLLNAIYKKGLRKTNAGPSTASANSMAESGKDISTFKEVAVDDTTGKANDQKPSSDEKNKPEAGEDSDDEESSGVGKIVTLMSSDVEKIREATVNIYEFATTPPQIVASLVGLVWLLGWPALTGVVIMILTLPATYYVSEIFNETLDKLMSCTDKRTNVVNEMLQSIRIIKFFAWEPNFLKKIKDARAKEMSQLVRYFITNAIAFLIWDCAPILVSFGTFFVYTYIAGYELNAKTAFAAIALFNNMRIPLLAYPELVVETFQLRVSIDRIQTFLEGEELEKYDSATDIYVSDVVDAPKVGFKDAWFSWRTGDDDKTSTKEQATESSNATPEGESTPLVNPSASSASLASVNSSSSTSQTVFTLRNLNLIVPENGLTCVTGATGSGKSSLIQALLGEMKRLSGFSHLPTTSGIKGSGVAYVAQTSWLMNATIRDNICFGEAYDPLRYSRVIKACALVKDLESFDAGDLTEIGEKGINLSGGQKQRVSLARATYSYAQFILLDDPLSAVDAPTARHLFEHAICGLLQGRTRILVTHAVALTLPRADHVVVMQNGEIFASGDVPTVLAVAGIESVISTDSAVSILRDYKKTDANDSETIVGSVEDQDISNLVDYGNGKTREDARKLVEKEESQEGAVKLSIYIAHLSAAGGLVFIGTWIAALLIERTAQTLDSFWIKRWIEAYKERDAIVNGTAPVLTGAACQNTFVPSYVTSGSLMMRPLWWSITLPISTSCDGSLGNSSFLPAEEVPPVNTLYFIGIYGAIVFLWIVCNQLGVAIRSVGSYIASKRLHDQLMERILGAPIRFFDKTPIGRILNRASKDIAAIDQDVVMAYHFVLIHLFDIITIAVVITYIIPLFFVAFLPFGYLYYRIAADYLASSRELKRLDSVTRSPIFSMFSETLTGAATIRAYGAEQRFEKENMRRIDANHRAYFYLWATNRWLGVRVSSVAGIVIFVSAAITVLSRTAIGPELAAIALIWSLNFCDYLIWLIREQARLEMTLNAVERVEEYLVIDQELPAVIESSRPPASWPSKGSISVKNLELKYSPELDPVLKNVSFDIPGGSKVGIVGRTGAGKSSLTLALFRIVEASYGTITIDGINISEIGLRDLRSNLTIIPQDPVLFVGTIRSNMDPFDEFDDAQIWASLDRVHIASTMQTASVSGSSLFASTSTLDMKVSSSTSTLVVEDASSESTVDPGSAPLSLDSVVAEGGSNFSQGQRQLLCLARALLKSSKITILDEATASVDNETDARIQEAIRGPDFAEVTVISIAHRLRTVADYDLILVLEKGEVSQFGKPWDLMQQDGIFRGMCEESGEFAELEEMAKKAYRG